VIVLMLSHLFKLYFFHYFNGDSGKEGFGFWEAAT
jgi:hypothetical protein